MSEPVTPTTTQQPVCPDAPKKSRKRSAVSPTFNAKRRLFPENLRRSERKSVPTDHFKPN